MAEDGDGDGVNLLYYKDSKRFFLSARPPISRNRRSDCDNFSPSLLRPRRRKYEACQPSVFNEVIDPCGRQSRPYTKSDDENSSSRSPSVARLLRRSVSSSPNRDSSCPCDEEKVKLVSFKRHHSLPEFNDRGVFNVLQENVMEKTSQETNSDIFSALPPEHSRRDTQMTHSGSERLCNILEEKFMNIPPPAGFGTPTRPSTLLAALVRGPVSLDESSLSPATQRRLAYVHRHTQSSFQIRQQSTNEGGGASIKSTKTARGEESSKTLSRENLWSAELPTSPLSPPSPFQHPFFRRQLGLLPNEPWARFSGFGLPRLNPLLHMIPGKEPLSNNAEEDEEKHRQRNGGTRKMTFNSSTTRSIICYCKDTKLYKACKEAHFFSDGVSETESEDEEEAFGTPVSQSHIPINNNHLLSKGKEEATFSSESTNNCNVSQTDLNSHSPKYSHSSYSFIETESKRNSQAASSEADIDDVSSLTTSEPDSFHDAPSPQSTLPEDYCHVDKPLSLEDVDVDNNSTASQDPSRRDKLHKVASEILVTERSYVKVLHLIDQEFQFRVDQQNRAHHLFPNDQMPQIFSNIKSIFKLHHDFLLPQLEDRMINWENNNRIGDIMKSFAPFLKMYTDYIRNFDNAMTVISFWQVKCPRFAAIMEEIHQMDACGNLTLQHHMLSPVQRIPRYEMLLRDYLKKLPEDSPDREDTEKALHLVSMAANHANDAMKKIDKFQKLLEVQESLGGSIELVSPTRELIKEGRIIKISARSGDHQERYLFLLSDLLLLCTPRLMGGRVISGPQYRLRAKYYVENLQVLEGDNLETANTFYIRDSNKTVELYTQTRSEKEAWLEALFQAIHETFRRKSSLKLSSHSDQRIHDPDLGSKQPTLIRTDSVTKCMQCESQFSVVRRKHHCRACGFIFCNKCLNHKSTLSYEKGKSVRVCQDCHEALLELALGSGTGSSGTGTGSSGAGTGTGPSSPEFEDRVYKESNSKPDPEDKRFSHDLSFKSKGVLEISAKASGATLQGFLHLKTHRKAWVKRWFALHSDFVLYSFKSDDDECALTATPVPGFTVTHLQNSKGDTSINEKERERVFKLHHAKKQYIFQASSREDAVRWIGAMQRASRAELPTPSQ